MKQQKLNFFTPAKKRATVDPEVQTNNNKKQKIRDDQENNNEKKESKRRSSSRPRRPCNKENFEIDQKRLDIINIREDQRDGRNEDKINLKSNDKKKTTIDGKKEVENSNRTEKKGISDISDRKKKGKEDIAAKSKTETETEKAKEDEEEEEANEKVDDEEEKTFSNSMKDAVKTECKICG